MTKKIRDNEGEFVSTFFFVFLVAFVCSGVFSQNLLLSIGVGLLLAILNSIIIYIRQL